MIFGRISRDEPVLRLNLTIFCCNCKKTVPGGVTVSKLYHDSDEFDTDLRKFMDAYLCGRCRDKKRVSQGRNKSSV